MGCPGLRSSNYWEEDSFPSHEFPSQIHFYRHKDMFKTAHENILLTILTGKNLYFTEFSTKTHWNTRLAASNVSYVFTINYVLLIPLSYRRLKNVIHQIDSKNEWLVLSVTFTAKFELVFVLTCENAFNRKSIDFSKKRY